MLKEVFEIPKQLPVMTLRGIVLFPKAMMPLRIFEERYRQMLDEVLSSTRIFGIVCERENVSEEEAHMEHPFDVATAGLIRVSKKHEDGTSFVLLQGIKRVKVRSISQELPYRIIETEEIEDESWIRDLIQHILSCLVVDCDRCSSAAENNFLGFLKTR